MLSIVILGNVFSSYGVCVILCTFGATVVQIKVEIIILYRTKEYVLLASGVLSNQSCNFVTVSVNMHNPLKKN